MGGPARLAGPQGATRSLSKLIKTLQALAYSEAQASLYSNQCLHCCLLALHLPNIGQNYRAVTGLCLNDLKNQAIIFRLLEPKY